MKELQAQYGDLRSIEISDRGTMEFERLARKYHVKYRIFRLEKGKYQIFFKAPNDEAMQAAFQEYAAKKLRKAQRPSVLKRLHELGEQVRGSIDRVRKKELER